MIHHKHPSTIPWLAPAFGSCTVDAWTSGSWHQACADVIAKAGNDDPLANPFTWASNIWRGMKEASNSKHFIFRNLLILYLELKWPFVWFGLALYMCDMYSMYDCILYVFKSHPAGMDECSSKPRNQWETSTSPGHRRASNLLATNQDSVHPWFLGGRRNLSSWPVWRNGPYSYQES